MTGGTPRSVSNQTPAFRHGLFALPRATSTSRIRSISPETLCANMTETPSVTAISEQGGKENQMATMNGSVRPAVQVTGILESVIGDITGGRAAPRPNPEVVAGAKRRRYTAEFKQRILAEADAAKESCEIVAVLRRNGLYSSHLVKWRRERTAGIVEGLTPQKRGPKSQANP
jgi:hypothetical protein